MLLWQCIHIEPDGLAIFRLNNQIFCAFGAGYLVGGWYKIDNSGVQFIH